MAAEKVIPRGCRKDPVCWWHEDIDEAIQARELRRLEMTTSFGVERVEAETAFKTACENVREVIKARRREHWLEFVSSLSYTTAPAVTARVIKEIRRERRTADTFVILSKSGKILKTDLEIATAFRCVYAKVCAKKKHVDKSRGSKAKRRNSKRVERSYCQSKDYSEYSKKFSMPEVKSSLSALNCNKAAPDGINNEMLINLEDDLLEELLDILNLSWRQGTVPHDWLNALIIPIHKGGSKCKKQLESYRPVALMSVIAKLMERMVCARLRYLLESRGLLHDAQSGFRKGRSTMDPLLDLVSDIQKSFELKGVTLLSAVDLSRALIRSVLTCCSKSSKS
jgi:hypothetical protein